MKRLSLPALALLLALPGSALAYTWTGAANDGILNTPENWNPVLPETPISDRWTTLAINFDNTDETAFTLTNVLSANYITFSGGSADDDPTVFDLGESGLKAVNTGAALRFYAARPLVFRNGNLNSASISDLGVSGNPASPVSLLFQNAGVTAWGHSYYTTNLTVTFQDTAVTNFLLNVPSNTRVLCDGASLFATSNGSSFPCDATASASNVSFRAVNGTRLTRGHTNRAFNMNASSSRYAFESESGFFATASFVGPPLTVGGRDNAFGFTNAFFAAPMTIKGTNNVVTFKSSAALDPGYKNRNFGVGGLGNRLVFEDSAFTNNETSISLSIENTMSGVSNVVEVTGCGNTARMGAVGIYGADNIFSIADNVVLSNAVKTSLSMSGYPMRPLFKSGSVNCSFLVGTNAVAEFWTWGGMPMGATNFLFRIGKGSSVRTVKNSVDKASTYIGGATGAGSRLVLDNASFKLLEGQWPTIVTGNVEIVLSGDSARFTISSSNGANSNYGVLRICPVADGLEPPHLVFRPGPTGFGGEAPFSTTVKSQGSNLLAPTTVFEVDATDFARRKPSGIYEIPLVKKGKSWSRCDLDALNAVGVFEPANGRLAADADNNIVFRFRRDCGTRLMLR